MLDDSQRCGDVTGLLEDFACGVPGAADRLIPVVYDELRSLASRHLHKERRGHTLQPTALVNEAYQRLVSGHNGSGSFPRRRDFFSFASRVMRNALVDYERKRQARKRGGKGAREKLRTTLDPGMIDPRLELDVLTLDEALHKLDRISPLHVRIVELRFFSGMTIRETAKELEIAEVTVKKYWSFARVWLLERMSGGAGRDE